MARFDVGGAGAGALAGFTAGSVLGPIGSGVGTAVGAGLGGFFGGGGEATKDDPLAPIRQKLLQLAEGIPDLVSRQKELIGEKFGKARRTGLEDITENVRGERGFGASSIESRLRSELIEGLAGKQAESELEAELAGVGLQSQLLTGAGGIPIQDIPEEEDILGDIVETGGTIFGQELAGRRTEKLLEKLEKRKGTL